MAPLFTMVHRCDATMVGIRGRRCLIEAFPSEFLCVSNLGIWRQRVAQGGIGYVPALDPSRGRLTDPAFLIWKGHLDPTDFFYHLLLVIMIKAIEDAFGTHDEQDAQAKANGASACSGIGLAEATEDVS